MDTITGYGISFESMLNMITGIWGESKRLRLDLMLEG